MDVGYAGAPLTGQYSESYLNNNVISYVKTPLSAVMDSEDAGAHLTGHHSEADFAHHKDSHAYSRVRDTLVAACHISTNKSLSAERNVDNLSPH